MEVKKKQHYVWKQYLTSWAENGRQIYFLHKDTNVVRCTNLENVAQKRFFYEVDAFTEDQEVALTYIISEWSTNFSRESNLAILKSFFKYSHIKRHWERLDFPEKEYKLNVVKKNALEDLHSMFEKFGEELLKVNSQTDLFVFDDDKERLKALMYLCIQYTRTNQMHSKALTESSVISVLPASSLKIIAITFAITLAANLTFSYNLKITLLMNSSNIEFITTDQPIINRIRTDELKNNKDELLEFYYPIGPKKALLIAISDESRRDEYELKMDSEVIAYNSLLLVLKPDFVFANREETLNRILLS
ncbi:DUF4238 domain-containing protein [Sphingobacterium rhinopitheci]|uniref:DUF4238 domain-containing protein n=1 Tax=Sphingobacterium rhinopitheci TaxID=2781960 RepID=UPI001F528C79|nr:DUF4238 domain-containing protein [Sphingobacterium rhinopitheci]MCI0922656.1 DUF4238 domain-containing protein [Sphingobacterium rhinopitheci]